MGETAPQRTSPDVSGLQYESRRAFLASQQAHAMPSTFDSRYTYGEQAAVFYDDGRELELLRRVYAQSPETLDRMRNNPSAVLEAIDSFATEKYLMNIGELKGKLVCKLIEERKPQVVLELGGYVGYSTILFGAATRQHAGPGARYYCLEHNPVFAAVTMALVSLAGLSDTVKVVIGESTDAIKRLHGDGTLAHVDMLFLDHLKHLYLPDLQLCETLRLVTPGTVLAADNMIRPGNPAYHRYVNMRPDEKRALRHPSSSSSSSADDDDDDDDEGDRVPFAGNPNLVYESELVQSWEPQGVPDAVELTRCVGVSS